MHMLDPVAYERDLGKARTYGDVQERYRKSIRLVGYTEAACGYFDITKRGAETSFYFQDWPPEWIALYRAENFVINDFVVSESRQRLMPFQWSDILAARALTPGENRILTAAIPFGWTNGFCVPVHGPGGYFGLVATAGNPGTLDLETLYRLHIISLLTHERCRLIAGTAATSAGENGIAARELECLRWVALGWDDQKIARRLGISPLTVKDYIVSARRKLGAETRAHAVAMLVARGLL